MNWFQELLGFAEPNNRAELYRQLHNDQHHYWRVSAGRSGAGGALQRLFVELKTPAGVFF